jgi:hypothetical protein
MSSERPEEISEPSASRGEPSLSSRPQVTARPETTIVVHGETLRDQKQPKSEPKESPPQPGEATVVVRGETVRNQDSRSDDSKTGQPQSGQPPSGKQPSHNDNGKETSSRKEVSEAKVKMQSRLPALDDDADVGVQKQHLITRDGKADLTFTGTLLASAAPPSAPQGSWKEYRIYTTNGGKHVFSKITRSVESEKQDTHEAEVFDPAPSSVPSKLLKSARELTHSRPLSWTDAAVAFFGYDPLAKVLYRKLGDQFDEHIT